MHNLDLGHFFTYLLISLECNGVMGFPVDSGGKESVCNTGDLGWEDPLEKGIATRSRILAWRIH